MRASCRISRGGRNEVATSTAAAGTRKKIWRLTKWNGSRPRRAATGGLAARHRTMPPSISAPSAASVNRSTVHHQSLNGVALCARGHGVPKPKSPPYRWHAPWFPGDRHSPRLAGGGYLFVTRPGSARTRSRNASPRTSKLRYWSNDAQAGRQQHDRFGGGPKLRRRRARPRRRARSSVPAISCGTSPPSVTANASAASPIR